MKTLSAIMTTLFGMLSREGKWTEKQRKFRRDCREEEKEVERMINWMEFNVEAIKRGKRAQNQMGERAATPVANDPDCPLAGASEGLACCLEPKCPCHGVDNV